MTPSCRRSSAGPLPLGLIAASLMVAGSGASRSPADVAVSFSLKHGSVTLHEPVYLCFTVRNRSAGLIKIDLGKNRLQGFEFSITAPNGSVIRPPEASGAGFGRPGAISLSPGGTYTQSLLLNRWYRLPEPGTYVIEASLVRPIRSGSGAVISTRVSEQLHLGVEPRNPERLKKVCSSLASTTGTAGSPEGAWAAATALSYVDDATAIPYLARVAVLERFRVVAVEGLARIAKSEGLSVVISRLTAKEAWLVPLIRSRLREVRAGATISD